MAPFAGVPAYGGGGGGGPTSSGQRWDGGASYDQQEGPFSPNGNEGVVVTVDPQLGFLAFGVYAPHGKPPVLRCWNVKDKKPLWEVLQGQGWLDKVSRSSLAVRGRNLYVANKRQLLCLDVATGNKKWNSSLSDSPVGSDDDAMGGEHIGGINIADPFPQGPGARGAILVPTIDNALFAFDRDSGQPLWQRSFGDKSIEVDAVAGLGACVVRYGSPYIKIDIVNPAFQQPIASLGHDHWSTDLGLARISGRTVLTVADDMGVEGDDDGLFCFDAVTGQAHFFDHVEDLDMDEIAPLAMGARAFAATDNGEGLYVGPRGRVMPPPVPNHAICAMFAAGPTLVLLLKKMHGTPVRRVVGIDPNTMAFRFDAGEAGSEPEYNFEAQCATDGYSFVFVATPQDDMSQCELRSVDTSTGRMLWNRQVGHWQGHRFIGGQLIVFSHEKIEALSPQNGQVLATLA
jgi:hypothetical protein